MDPNRSSGRVLDSWTKKAGATRTLIVDGAALKDGARTLIVGYDGAPAGTWDRRAGGDLLVEVSLRAQGLVYNRRFNLARWRAVEIPCAAFEAAWVAVTDTTTSEFSARVVVTTGEPHPGLVELVPLAQSIAVATDQVVPDGAEFLIPRAGDPGFAWNIGGQNFPRTLTAAVQVPIAGTAFDPTAVNLFVWGIRL